NRPLCYERSGGIAAGRSRCLAARCPILRRRPIPNGRRVFTKGLRMFRRFGPMSPILSLLLICLSSPLVRAQGVMIPANRDVAPLSMVSHQVEVAIEDQVAVTKVTQVFHNPADRALEATYVFPVPKGASVRKFTMWVDGKEVNGELVEADKA